MQIYLLLHDVQAHLVILIYFNVDLVGHIALQELKELISHSALVPHLKVYEIDRIRVVNHFGNFVHLSIVIDERRHPCLQLLDRSQNGLNTNVILVHSVPFFEHFLRRSQLGLALLIVPEFASGVRPKFHELEVGTTKPVFDRHSVPLEVVELFLLLSNDTLTLIFFQDP